MSVRLSQIGLTPPTPRCLPKDHDWTLQAMSEIREKPTYQRLAHAIT
jgi:hypothetical protein